MMIFEKQLQVTVSTEKFTFSNEIESFEFEPTLQLNEQGLIVNVGAKPTALVYHSEVDVFASTTAESYEFLVAAIHHGLQKFKGRFRILPSHLQVVVTSDLADILGELEVQIFELAGKEAGASQVNVTRIKHNSTNSLSSIQ